MKKVNLKVAAVLLAFSMMSSSCIGSFSLFNKYAKWQCNMSSSKYLNAIVGFFLMPIVGSVTLLVDSLVLNSIEFWSGNNPVQANVGKNKTKQGEDGRMYAVKTLKDGYEVTDADGNVTIFKYNKKNDSWSMTQNGQTRELFRFDGDGSIKACINGQELTFSLDAQGVRDAELAAAGVYFAAK